MAAKKVLVFLGSTRDGRFGLRVGKLVVEHLQSVGLSPVLIDPLEIDAPLVRQPFHFMSEEQRKTAPEWMKKLSQEIAEANGFVLVSPEYNATIAPALTNLLDYFPPASFRHKPVSIATYSMGGFGGARARVALLPFVSELGLVALPATVAIPSASGAGIADDGNTENERILTSVKRLCNELKWYINALDTHKEAASGYPN